MIHAGLSIDSSHLLCTSVNTILATFDFKIVSTNIAGISSIEPQNEEALDYLINEAHLSVFQDGSAALFSERIGDFVSDAGWAHLSTELV